MTSDDIVPRLRLWADGLERQHAVPLAVAIREAADEIDLLRAERGTARHGVSCAIETLMHAVEERETLRAERDRARAERDGARAEVCLLRTGPTAVTDTVTQSMADYAEERGWKDLFREDA
jgi:hypothetical protein